MPRLFCVTSVALGKICLHFVRQAWHLRHWAGSGDCLGRRWVCVMPRLFCVTSMALSDICLRFVWQARRLATRTFTLRGRCGTYGTGLGLVTALVGAGHGTYGAGLGLVGLGRRWVCVTPRLFYMAGVPLGDICLRLARHAWHLATRTFALCGRRGTHGTGLAQVVALVGAGSV
eukprot:s212_g18.t1